MREMPCNQNVASLSFQPIAHAPRRIVRLKIGGCGKLRQGVAGSPEGLGRLSRAQLAAMPHHSRPRTMRCRLARGSRCLSLSNR